MLPPICRVDEGGPGLDSVLAVVFPLDGTANSRETNDALGKMLDFIYHEMEGSEDAERYSERHGIKSAAILTVAHDETAYLIASHLAKRIEGRVVIEIGGGIGLLGCHLAQYARRVYCIEANPMWAWTFATVLLKHKPKNLSYLFGAADEFVGRIRGGVALFCTHSGKQDMQRAGLRFADEVIDVYGEIIDLDPERFDKFARTMREVV